MVRPQFSLLQLVLLVGVVGVTLALARVLLLFGPWAFDVGLAPLVLCIVLLVAIFSRGTFRAYLLGFHLLGWLGFVGSFAVYAVLVDRISALLERHMIDDNDYTAHALLVAILLVPTMVVAHMGGAAFRHYWAARLGASKTQA
jgi:hypothetical protein